MAYAVENNLKILWLTRTGSQVSHLSREVSALPVYGRRMVCLHETVSKIDLRRFNATCRAVRRSGRCPYWPGLPRTLRPPLTVGEIKEVGRRFEVCPYDCLVASLQLARVTAATHMQLSSIGWLLSKWRAKREGTILILDEGQHVIKNALAMTRDSISIRTLEKAAREAVRYGFKQVGEDIGKAAAEYRSLLESDGEAQVEDLLPELDELLTAGEEVQDMKLREGYVPASYLLSLADFKMSIHGNLILVREGGSIRLETLQDPVESLKSVYDGWHAVITMSATISGELIESLIGRETMLLRAGWPFEEENMVAYLVKGLSTKFEKRDESLTNDMAWVIDLAAKRGLKTLIFFPSFELLEKALTKTKAKDVVAESPGIDQEEVEKIISEYTEGPGKMLLSVYNGRLAEGVDLSANLVICLGVPFSPPTIKQQALTKRLSEVLGDEKKARVYGQIIPAVWSAIQAAGRAVRGPNDRATVFLVDDRYRPLLRLLPRWFTERIVGSITLNDLPITLGGVV
jgi:Rad3-related DNA helicase